MDADLLLAATYRGDLRAFEALVRSQAGRLHRLASRVTGDETLADDVLQETFLRVLRVPEAARPSRSAAGWLARVTVRVALNLLESERSRRRREERYATERNEEMKHAAFVGTAGLRDLEPPVAAALASLSPETRAALWLHVVEGEGVREVAVCLDSSRSAVSRRIRAGLEALRSSLAKSGAGLAGVAALRGALRGSETSPAESLVGRILEAGRKAMASTRAPAVRVSALDVALAAPVRSLRTSVGMASAAVVTAGLLAALGWYLLRPDGRGGPEALAPVPPPIVRSSKEVVKVPRSEARPVEAAPSPPAPQPVAVSGTVRDEDGEPIASARVYLAFHPPARDDQGQDAMLGGYFRPDYFARSRFLDTRTDDQGRFAFASVRESGVATLSAFKEDHAGAANGVRIDRGSPAVVDLVLAEGGTLTGRVLGGNIPGRSGGSPVADAVVSVCQAWSATDHVFRGAGLGPTDEEGRFRLGLGAGTTACHLRVNSDSQGQDFFIEVPVREEGVELSLKEFAAVRGRITWSDGTPASGLTVRATGRLPEPRIPVERMGMRPTTVHDGPVGADGTYYLPRINPQLSYDIFVIDGSLGEREASMKPLSPRMVNSFRLEPGEVKVWDHSVPKAITLRGRIRTEKGNPLPQGHVGARKDGRTLHSAFAEADGEGFYELHLNAGPGEYVVHAEPPPKDPAPEGVGDLIARQFGKTLRLAGGQTAEVDLTIFEPAAFPLRVLDHRRQPVREIRAVLHVTLPDGRKGGYDAPRVLDETGRVVFSLYYPAAEFWYEIRGADGAPPVETRRYASQPGTALPEETVVLPRTCDLTAVLLDASGNAWRERTVYLSVEYPDGPSANLAGHTDREGRLEVNGRVRAGPFVVEIRSTASKVLWKSQPLDGSAGNPLDLGQVVLGPEGD